MKNLLDLLMFHLFFVVFLFVVPVCFGDNDAVKWYNECGNNFTCGKVSVGFPFWGGSSRPQRCGYPLFKLSCDDENTTTIEITNMTYYVMEVREDVKVVKLAREDFHVQGVCLQKFVNTSLNYDLFGYSQETQNITVLYGCPAAPQSISYDGSASPPSPGQFPCKIRGTTNSVGLYQTGASGPTGDCLESVVVPIMESWEQSISSSGLGAVIDKGFDVYYKVQDDVMCANCTASNGRCGFNSSISKATCVCADGTYGYEACSGSSISPPPPAGLHAPQRLKLVGISLGFFAVALGLFSFVLWYFKRTSTLGTRSSTDSQDIEDFIKTYGTLAQKTYTYKDLKKITNSFKDKLGEGGYGTVYKGKLLNRHQVAVKLLKESNQNAEEFINEVKSSGRANHVNVVTLLGFCFEGQRRALVYDFMPNGSLEKYIYKNHNYQTLESAKLFNVAVGIARGLEYLHRGCNTKIVHFDIKPHNILLDKHFCPKISDFGLAKSCQTNKSILSMSGARGTVGFIAPELCLRGFGNVSHKSDVYSYGMLVLEMVGIRENVDAEAQRSSEQYFPQYIYKELEQTEVVDHQHMMNGDLRKMIMVSLWCVQIDSSSRPAMSKVVEMLEGSVDSLQIPPISSLTYPPSSQLGFSTVETNSLSTLAQTDYSNQ